MLDAGSLMLDECNGSRRRILPSSIFAFGGPAAGLSRLPMSLPFLGRARTPLRAAPAVSPDALGTALPALGR